jgi:DNA-binding NarL/FixJ family response regulator
MSATVVDQRRGMHAPTLAEFVRHLERYGPELLLETAATFLSAQELLELELAVAGHGHRNGKPAGGKNGKPRLQRQRRTTPRLREQVLELHRRGLLPAAIADQLNLSDRRVAEIIADSRRPENDA